MRIVFIQHRGHRRLIILSKWMNGIVRANWNITSGLTNPTNKRASQPANQRGTFSPIIGSFCINSEIDTQELEMCSVFFYFYYYYYIFSNRSRTRVLVVYIIHNVAHMHTHLYTHTHTYTMAVSMLFIVFSSFFGFNNCPPFSQRFSNVSCV